MPGVRITSLRPNQKTAFMGGLLQYETKSALALGFFRERCRRQKKREEKGAAVEILRRSTAGFREPQEAAQPKMPGVRITSLRP